MNKEAGTYSGLSTLWLLPTVLLVILMFAGCSPAGNGPLSFQAPADWKVQHQSLAGLHSYSLMTGPPNGGSLMLVQQLSPNKPEEIPGLVQKFADDFLDEAKQSPKLNLRLASREYHVEQFTGSQCEGSYVIFHINTGTSSTNVLQTMFMMSADGKVWSGQFTGSSNTWEQAIEVLKSVKTR